MKKWIPMLLLLLTLAACAEREYETEPTSAYNNTPLVIVEKDTLYYGERRIEIINNTDAPIFYTTEEIIFDVNYTEESLGVWAEENLTHITNAIFDHIISFDEVVIAPNGSIVLIIDMASHPYDISISLNFDIDGEGVLKNILLPQNDSQ